MSGSWGVTPAGFQLKPFAQIVADLQAAFLTNIDPGLDLSPTSPEGELVTIFANGDSQLWELAQACYNASDPQAAEGAAADNIGALRGIPRADESFTQVFCTLTWTDSGTVHAPNSLTANVLSTPAFKFTNVNSVTSNGGTTTGILFQATTAGATATVNPNTLTEITNPVSGWASITNPFAQSQLGANEEGDAAYLARQDAELGVDGGNSLRATAAALLALGDAQSPPIALGISVLENDTDSPIVTAGMTLTPHSFAVVVYDPTNTLTSQQIGGVIYANKPPGIPTLGTTSVTIADPLLGNQIVNYTTPAPQPLFVVVVVVPRSGVVFSTLQQAIATALEEAAIAPTPAGGEPPVGQFAPGTPAIKSQIEGVVQSVPGVFDVQQTFFALSPVPTNTAPILVPLTQIITVDASHVLVVQGSYP